jgi:hypothetical protein
MATTARAKKRGTAAKRTKSAAPKSKLTPEVKAVIRNALFAGKGMGDCHIMLRETKGIWIPELVPVFKKLDKMLGLPRR